MLKKLLLILMLAASCVVFAGCESKEDNDNDKVKDKNSSSDTAGAIDPDEGFDPEGGEKNDDKDDEILAPEPEEIPDPDSIAKKVFIAVNYYAEKSANATGLYIPDGTYKINITAPLDSRPDVKLCQTDTENQIAIAIGSDLDKYADDTYAEVVIKVRGSFDAGYPEIARWSKTEGSEITGTYPPEK